MDVQPQNVSQMVDDIDQSTKLEDLNLKDWPLEDSFEHVFNFLDPMLSNFQDTEPERSISTPSSSSVSLSKRSSLYETCVQIYQKQDHQLEALEQQMDEISVPKICCSVLDSIRRFQSTHEPLECCGAICGKSKNSSKFFLWVTADFLP